MTRLYYRVTNNKHQATIIALLEYCCSSDGHVWALRGDLPVRHLLHPGITDRHESRVVLTYRMRVATGYPISNPSLIIINWYCISFSR